MSNDAEDQARAAVVFRDTIGHFEEAPFDYAVGGGLATDHWTGGATKIADIDLVIREQDSRDILQRFGSAGYDTSEMEDSWLHKAFKDGVTIDLMFELKNGTRFDRLFKEHRKRGDMFGSRCFVMAVEDQVTSLAGTVGRDTIGQHWYNIINLMANNDLEWDYVITRSKEVPRRMLSVVHFAVAEQVPVPKGVIEKLTEMVAAAER